MLYERIKQCANERKISITNLEKALGFGNGTIGKWKTYMPSTTKIQKVADYFGKPIEYFLQGEEPAMQNVGNVLNNSINESDNAVLIIHQDEENSGLSKQELEIISTYRELGIAQQAEFIQFLLKLKSDKSE